MSPVGGRTLLVPSSVIQRRLLSSGRAENSRWRLTPVLKTRRTYTKDNAGQTYENLRPGPKFIMLIAEAREPGAYAERTLNMQQNRRN